MLSPTTATQLDAHLRAIPRLCALAYLDLVPATSTRYGSIHTARLNAPSPVNERILSLLGPGDYLNQEDEHGDQDGPMPAAAVLGEWARIVTGRYYRRISPACAVLLERWPATTGNHWSGRLAADVGRLHGVLEAAAHARAYRRELALPCPRCTLLALVAEDGRDVECSNCHATMSQAAYDQRADAYADKIGA